VRIRLLLAGAALALMSVAAAQAHVRHHYRHHQVAARDYAAPERPIPYAQVNRYLAGSPAERSRIVAVADTGTRADVNATDRDWNWAANGPPPEQPKPAKKRHKNNSPADSSSLGGIGAAGGGTRNEMVGVRVQPH
jgi:hypothetical protein